jgi:hypothetical protein
MNKYWVHSDTRDYVALSNGKYTLYFRDYKTPIELSESQFDDLTGFLPIKSKKLFSRNRKRPNNNVKVDVKSIEEIREERLKNIGI